MGSPLRVMVTAGASGIGAAIASRFAAEGALVSVLDADPAAVSGVAGMHAVVARRGGEQHARILHPGLHVLIR